MQTAPVPFLFQGDQLVRVILKEDDPWFVAADVCKVLAIIKHRDAVARLDEDERGSVVVDTLGGRQEVSAVSEGGLYVLIFRSRKPVAIAFRKWVTGEVLPSIRKTGRYDPANEGEIIPPSERRPFPDWPMEEMRTKKGVGDMYRMVYGVPAAQWIMPQLGFPTPPKELIEHGRQIDLFRSLSSEAAE